MYELYKILFKQKKVTNWNVKKDITHYIYTATTTIAVALITIVDLPTHDDA